MNKLPLRIMTAIGCFLLIEALGFTVIYVSGVSRGGEMALLLAVTHGFAVFAVWVCYMMMTEP